MQTWIARCKKLTHDSPSPAVSRRYERLATDLQNKKEAADKTEGVQDGKRKEQRNDEKQGTDNEEENQPESTAV